jgi:hypothetical protein
MGIAAQEVYTAFATALRDGTPVDFSGVTSGSSSTASAPRYPTPDETVWSDRAQRPRRRRPRRRRTLDECGDADVRLALGTEPY